MALKQVKVQVPTINGRCNTLCAEGVSARGLVEPELTVDGLGIIVGEIVPNAVGNTSWTEGCICFVNFQFDDVQFLPGVNFDECEFCIVCGCLVDLIDRSIDGPPVNPNAIGGLDLIFGDGSDGNLTVPTPDANVGLTTYTNPFPARSRAYNNLNILTNGVLTAYGQSVFSDSLPAQPVTPGQYVGYVHTKILVKDTLTVSGKITAAGKPGANGGSGSLGSSRPGAPVAEDGSGGGADWGGPGGGANSSTRTGSRPSGAGTAESTSGYRSGKTGLMGGGFGGAGGSGGSNGSTAGYAGGDPSANVGGVQAGYPVKIHSLITSLEETAPYSNGRVVTIGGGTGGGGGGAGQGGQDAGDGGAGGSGGGTIFILAKKVVLNATAVFDVKGGNGGNGGTAVVGAPTFYTLSGSIIDTNSTPIDGVTVDAGPLGVTTTNASGAYSFPSIPAGTNYTLVATRVGYTFNGPFSGVLNANTIAPAFVGTAVAPVGYNPVTYFTGGSLVNWYAFWDPSGIINGASPATDGQTIDYITDKGGSLRDSTVAPGQAAVLRTGVINGFQALEYTANLGGYNGLNFDAILNNASSLTVGWVGSLTDASANADIFIAQDNSYSYPRVRSYMAAPAPAANWNTQDGVDQGNDVQTNASQILTLGLSNYHAVLWVYNFATGRVNIHIDNVAVSNINPHISGLAQNIPATLLNDPLFLRNAKGRTVDTFTHKNAIPTAASITQWFADVKAKFNLTAY